jgi:hypothetical protein
MIIEDSENDEEGLKLKEIEEDREDYESVVKLTNMKWISHQELKDRLGL